MSNVSVICGCSFSFPLEENGNLQSPYGVLLSRKLNLKSINLSKPGSSNYFISKQIEHSIKFNPKLVIIGCTTPLRFDFLLSDRLLNRPNFLNFNYESHKTYPFTFDKGNIISRSLMWYELNSKREKDAKLRKKYTEIFNFLVNHVDLHIKIDQDRFNLLGAINLLKENNIQYKIIDFCNILKKTDDENIVNLFYEDLKNKFPHPDGQHFNQEGHNFIFETMLSKFKKLI